MRLTLVLPLVLLAAPAAAQSLPSAEAVQGVDPQLLLGAPLLTNEEKYELTRQPQYQLEVQPLPVIPQDAVKDAAAYTAADAAACEASGGFVADLPAGRKGCLRF